MNSKEPLRRLPPGGRILAAPSNPDLLSALAALQQWRAGLKNLVLEAEEALSAAQGDDARAIEDYRTALRSEIERVTKMHTKLLVLCVPSVKEQVVRRTNELVDAVKRLEA